jgi:serine O-acetyltransferase
MKLVTLIVEDLKNNSGNKLINIILSLLYNQSFRLILNYRLGNFCYINKFFLSFLILKILKKRQINKYGCDISYECKIGRRIKFPHPIGIVIGTGVIIENDVMIWQHVTLGSITKNFNKNYPVIKSFVKLYSNSQVLGFITVNEHAIVGASSVVLKDVYYKETVIGIPAKVLKK